MAKNKQVVHLMVYQVPVNFVAKPGYSKAFIYLIYANGIVAVYSAVVVLCLLISFCKARRGKFFAGVNFLMDQAVTYTLLAAAAASTEFSYIAKRGAIKVNWTEVCSQFNRFCNIVGVSLVLTFLSVLVMGFVSILSARRLFKQPVPVAEKAVANDVPEP